MALATYCFLNAWLHCNSTVVATTYCSTGRNISSTLCPKRMEIDYYYAE